MRRENNAGNNNFYGLPYSPQPTAVSFVSFQPRPRPLMKQSLNLDSSPSEYSNNNISKEYRPVVQTNSSESNNAFSHLRNQITNLRTQFSRLIQKEVNSPMKKGQGTPVKGNFQLRKDDGLPVYSPFDYHNAGRVANDSHKQIGVIAFKNKLLQQQRLAADFQHENINKIMRNDDQYSRIHKISSKNLYKISQMNLIETPEIIVQNKIRDLEADMAKLKQQKNSLLSQTSELKKKLIEKQKEYFRQNQLLSYDFEKEKKRSEQINISLSLKNSLVQKLQKEQQKMKNEIDSLEKRHKESEQQMIKIKERYESQIASLENTNNKSMNNVIQKYRETEEQLQKMTAILLVKQDQIIKKSKEIEDVKNKYKFQQLNYKRERVDLVESLTKANTNLNGQNQIFQHKIHQLEIQIEFIKKNNKNSNTQSGSRQKQLQQENIDLRKRVESYKKTIEQFNSSNNTAREKQFIFKQENRLLKEELITIKEENKMIIEQACLKENLITSLYRDINILDNELRSCNHLKNQSSSYTKYIEQLNSRILVLQFQKVNAKYSRR